jgi:two-component system sensor histidine kinase HydH
VLGAIDFGLSEIESVVSEDKKEHVKSIYKSYEMIHEMALRLQKIGKTQIETEMKTINVGEFISQTIEFARRHRKLKLCDVRMKKVGTSILSVNPFLFEQMLINLMLNAADATEQQGIIELNVENREDQIAIEVHDNGPGISEENKERIFQPFHTTKTDGTGLGLTTVQLCAELHNGSIDIEKSPLGGALFKITFPQIPIRKSDSKN